MEIPPPPGQGGYEDDEFAGAVVPGSDFSDLAVPEIEEVIEPVEVVEPVPRLKGGKIAASLGEPRMQAVLKNHKPHGRERIIGIARQYNISDDDPVWPIVLVVAESISEHAENVEKVVEVLEDGPRRMREAVENVVIAHQENTKVAHQTRELAEEGLKVCGHLREETKAFIKERKILQRWIIGFGIGMFLMAAYMTLEVHITGQIASQINTERFSIISRGAEMMDLQRLVIERMQIEAERTEYKFQYGMLREDWQKEGATPELEKKRKKLETGYAALKERLVDLTERERRAYAMKQ